MGIQEIGKMISKGTIIFAYNNSPFHTFPVGLQPIALKLFRSAAATSLMDLKYFGVLSFGNLILGSIFCFTEVAEIAGKGR